MQIMQDNVQFKHYRIVICIGEKENPLTSLNITGSKSNDSSCEKSKLSFNYSTFATWL